MRELLPCRPPSHADTAIFAVASPVLLFNTIFIALSFDFFLFAINHVVSHFFCAVLHFLHLFNLDIHSFSLTYRSHTLPNQESRALLGDLPTRPIIFLLLLALVALNACSRRTELFALPVSTLLLFHSSSSLGQTKKPSLAIILVFRHTFPCFHRTIHCWCRSDSPSCGVNCHLVPQKCLAREALLTWRCLVSSLPFYLPMLLL